MRITIGSYNVTDGEQVSPSGLRVNRERALQVSEPVRAEEISVFPRGLKRVELSFDCHRQHDDARAAQDFFMRHEAELPTEGTVAITTTSASGAQTTWTINNAYVRSHNARHTGASTFHSYTIIGGRVQNLATAS